LSHPVLVIFPKTSTSLIFFTPWQKSASSSSSRYCYCSCCAYSSRVRLRCPHRCFQCHSYTMAINTGPLSSSLLLPLFCILFHQDLTP
jgi:hypothetical protein